MLGQETLSLTIRAASGNTSSDYLYTGQRSKAELGLYYYGARFYDPTLGRFIQADTIVPQPGNPMAWDRYAYGFNNPSRYTDPSGHIPLDIIVDILFLAYDVWAILVEGPTPINEAALAADAVCAVIPYGTGGGLAVRLGGEAAIEAVTHLPAGVRAYKRLVNLHNF